jgi:hypothetical protein
LNRDISAMFPQTGRLIAVQKGTGLDGRPCYRVVVLHDDFDASAGFAEYPIYLAALAAAEEIGKRLNLPVVDLANDGI